ncbi:unnamed protein product, partial [marine sediment metagenome]
FLKGINEKECASPKEISEGANINESAAKKIAINKVFKQIVK